MNKNESFIELITQKKLDGFVEQNIGFSSNIFMVFGLPTCKVKDNPFVWEKKTSLCNLTIQRHPKYEIPYGCCKNESNIH